VDEGSARQEKKGQQRFQERKKKRRVQLPRKVSILCVQDLGERGQGAVALGGDAAAALGGEDGDG
jgi:hypothetical protein